jgi:hypothetical protein
MLAPLTFERDFLLQSIREAGPNDVSRGGTNFSNAFYEAVAILGPMTYSPKLLFLLTDDEDLEGDAPHVVKQIKDAGIQIVPVAIGTEARAPMVVKNEDGSSDYVRDLSGAMVLSKIRPGFLADLAKESSTKPSPGWNSRFCRSVLYLILCTARTLAAGGIRTTTRSIHLSLSGAPGSSLALLPQ